MITININGKKFKGVYSWEDVTLGRYCELASIPMPEGYEAFVLADAKFSVENIDQYIQEVAKITDEQLKAFPAFYRKVIGVMANVPDNVVIPEEEVTYYYDYYFKPFVLSLLYYRPVIHYMGQVAEYTPERITRLRIGRRRFILPQTIRIMDQDIPLFNEPIITYSEAMDVMGGTRITRSNAKNLALFMSIYCRKWWEGKYSEKRSRGRQELFMEAPMSAVWSVFFYTVRRLPDYRLITLLFGRLPKPASEVVQAAKVYKVSATEASCMK